jgi:hypothetical protein
MVDTQSVSIVVPESLADIKLEDYKKFIALANEDNGDEQALYYFCGLTPAQQEGMKKKDRDELTAQLGKVLNEKPPLIQSFKHKGVEYGFHPKLEDISLGEYVDLDEYLKEPYKDAEKVLGVLYRPITKKALGRHLIEPYDPDKHTGSQFSTLGAHVFLGCLLFFCRIEVKLQIATLQSLGRPQGMSQHLMPKANSAGSGAGMAQSIKLLEAIYKSLMK